MSIGQSNGYGVADASYRAAGGYAGIYRLVERFYYHMDNESGAKKIRAMHAANLSMPIDKLACFLSGWMGGPRRFNEKYGGIHIPQFHAAFTIGPQEADAWLYCMGLALDEQDYADDFNAYLKEQFQVPAQRIVAMNERV